MKSILTVLLVSCFSLLIVAQEGIPEDYLSADFHKSRREALRKSMPENAVAVFFANPVRNRANDVDYIYHQDPDFYYLTGYKEPHAVLVVFSENQTNSKGETFNELIYVQEKNPQAEQWTGVRLGTEGAKEKLGFEIALNGKEFINSNIDFASFEKVLFNNFNNDYRDSSRNNADLYSLISSFKNQI
ncbi:MAG: aminopeptidase P N-terminal domain-containing protein, partial [Oceanihabitans sp.]